MRRLHFLSHVSRDGVIEAPGGPDADRDGGCGWGGRAMAHADPAVGKAIAEARGDRFDLVLGRRTYDIWASDGPGRAGWLAEGLNAATKHAATHRPDSLA